MDEKGEIKRRTYHLDPHSIQLLIINNIALKFTKNIINFIYKFYNVNFT